MKVHAFITTSAVLLCAWLTACYLRVVPMETYPVEPRTAGVSASSAVDAELVKKGDDMARQTVVAR